MKLIPLLLLVGMLVVSGWAYDYDYRTPEPYSEELVKKAEAGDAEAQFALSTYYYVGDRFTNGATQDYKEAVKWLTKSAEQGNAYAQMMLGACYMEGNGITKNEKEAVKWFTKSAEQGNVLG